MKYSHFKYKKYSADMDGNVYGARGGTLKPMSHHTGYRVITVRNKGKEQKQYRIHRFIMECILGREINPDLVINHKDGNKQNNTYSNLEEVTSLENIEHAFANNLRSGMKGGNNPGSKLTDVIVKDIIRNIKKGKSNKEIAENFFIEPKHASLIRNKKRWLHIFNEKEFIDYIPIRSKYKEK